MPAACGSAADPGDLWVFGYGSLMWRPGFDHQESQPALLRGYRRALCVLSHHHRGTRERPGLVLGLDRGGSCRGVAFRVAASSREETLAYLRAREQISGVYAELHRPVLLAGGRRVEALTYVVDRAHAQYAGRLPREELRRLVMQGFGISGPNPDYVRNTHALLTAMGVSDPTLAWLDAELGEAPAG